MDVVFLRSNELNWEENYERATTVLGFSPILIDGSTATSIKNAYEIMRSHLREEIFMMIEADNYLLDTDDIHNFLHDENPVPAKFWTSNHYLGVTYEHGGIKIMSKSALSEQLINNNKIHPNFEVSANLFLKPTPVILSEHRFNWSPKNEFTTIAKELIKLYYWSAENTLDLWLQHDYPRRILYDFLVPNILATASFTSLFNNLLPSLGKIYDQHTGEIEQSLRYRGDLP
jgi:hypothetical protein